MRQIGVGSVAAAPKLLKPNLVTFILNLNFQSCVVVVTLEVKWRNEMPSIALQHKQDALLPSLPLSLSLFPLPLTSAPPPFPPSSS